MKVLIKQQLDLSKSSIQFSKCFSEIKMSGLQANIWIPIILDSICGQQWYFISQLSKSVKFEYSGVYTNLMPSETNELLPDRSPNCLRFVTLWKSQFKTQNPTKLWTNDSCCTLRLCPIFLSVKKCWNVQLDNFFLCTTVSLGWIIRSKMDWSKFYILCKNW